MKHSDSYCPLQLHCWTISAAVTLRWIFPQITKGSEAATGVRGGRSAPFCRLMSIKNGCAQCMGASRVTCESRVKLGQKRLLPQCAEPFNKGGLPGNIRLLVFAFWRTNITIFPNKNSYVGSGHHPWPSVHRMKRFPLKPRPRDAVVSRLSVTPPPPTHTRTYSQ